jgi:hypothetical protein
MTVLVGFYGGEPVMFEDLIFLVSLLLAWPCNCSPAASTATGLWLIAPEPIEILRQEQT